MNKNKIAIITMANNDYLPFTKNCIKSLENIGLKDLIRVYCVDENCYDNISKEHKHTQLIKHNLSGDLDKLQRFPKGPAKLIKLARTESTFKDLVFLKFIALSDALKKHEYVFFVDGDVIFLCDKFIEYSLKNINDVDILFQSDSNLNEIDAPCSGVMFVKSNNKTQQFFDMKQVKSDLDYTKFIGDQDYVLKNKNKLMYGYFSKELFPNGKVFWENRDKLKPYLIHYNWCAGGQKYKRMKLSNGWFL